LSLLVRFFNVGRDVGRVSSCRFKAGAFTVTSLTPLSLLRLSLGTFIILTL
jgi:hypothetical protein